MTSFGVFWTGEGLGADWPGADLALIGIFAIIAAASFAFFSRNSSTSLRCASSRPARGNMLSVMPSHCFTV